VKGVVGDHAQTPPPAQALDQLNNHQSGFLGTRSTGSGRRPLNRSASMLVTAFPIGVGSNRGHATRRMGFSCL